MMFPSDAGRSGGPGGAALRTVQRQDPDRPRTVALMTTCLTELAQRGPADATRRVLEAMGLRVEVPPQTCCGQPALNSGFPDDARRVLDGLLASFDGYDAVVTPSGSCAAMVVHHAVQLLGPATVQRSGYDRLWEFTQFVTAFGGDLRLRLPGTVTYHDGCHMNRFLGERHTPRELLGRIEGLELVEMLEPDTCCGFGGTFAVKFPELSVAMADVKLGHARETGAHYLVSADPGCLTHLQGRADHAGVGVRTLHIAELVALALDGAE